MTAWTTVIKNKRPTRRSVWIVSVYDDPIDIMRKDYNTMVRLQHELYPPKAKKKTVVIDRIGTKTQVGTTSNHNHDEGNDISESLQEEQGGRSLHPDSGSPKKDSAREVSDNN